MPVSEPVLDVRSEVNRKFQEAAAGVIADLDAGLLSDHAAMTAIRAAFKTIQGFDDQHSQEIAEMAERELGQASAQSFVMFAKGADVEMVLLHDRKITTFHITKMSGTSTCTEETAVTAAQKLKRLREALGERVIFSA